MLQLGPYTQTGHAYRIDAALSARETAGVVTAERRFTAKTAPYDPNRHRHYADPYAADLDLLLADAFIRDPRRTPSTRPRPRCPSPTAHSAP
ncbi:hypothetical protein [Streptomyces sp. B27]|uniref:hypothetical protein n=1 Tax=Streptomyces sp. B27 TaxID=2485015 RepID=UPI0019D1A1BE|nr:hypothetical protein [Streptomyces sp. B27]